MATLDLIVPLPFSHRQTRKWNGNGSPENARVDDSGLCGFLYLSRLLAECLLSPDFY
jgi:hypothetical protein